MGDKHAIQADAFSGWDAQEEYFEKEMGAVVPTRLKPVLFYMKPAGQALMLTKLTTKAYK